IHSAQGTGRAYAVFGIPITLLCHSNIGFYMASLGKILYVKVFFRFFVRVGDDVVMQKVHVPVWLCFALLIGYLCLGATMFSQWQDWTFVDAVYFCFTTLSTIGFGDLVPGFDGNVEDTENFARQFICVFSLRDLLLGLAVLAMIFELIKLSCEDIFHCIGVFLELVKHEDADAPPLRSMSSRSSPPNVAFTVLESTNVGKEGDADDSSPGENEDAGIQDKFAEDGTEGGKEDSCSKIRNAKDDTQRGMEEGGHHERIATDGCYKHGTGDGGSEDVGATSGRKVRAVNGGSKGRDASVRSKAGMATNDRDRGANDGSQDQSATGASKNRAANGGGEDREGTGGSKVRAVKGFSNDWDSKYGDSTGKSVDGSMTGGSRERGTQNSPKEMYADGGSGDRNAPCDMKERALNGGKKSRNTRNGKKDRNADGGSRTDNVDMDTDRERGNGTKDSNSDDGTNGCTQGKHKHAGDDNEGINVDDGGGRGRRITVSSGNKGAHDDVEIYVWRNGKLFDTTRQTCGSVADVGQRRRNVRRCWNRDVYNYRRDWSTDFYDVRKDRRGHYCDIYRDATKVLDGRMDVIASDAMWSRELIPLTTLAKYGFPPDREKSSGDVRCDVNTNAPTQNTLEEPQYESEGEAQPTTRPRNMRDYCQKFAIFLASTFGLTVFVALYCVLGAFMFIAFEKPGYALSFADIQKETAKLVDSDPTKFEGGAVEILRNMTNQLFSTNRRGFDSNGHTKWTFTGALLYSVTVVTTIGYGDIVPRTYGGRTATMFYATFGIPLALLCLANLGYSMASLHLQNVIERRNVTQDSRAWADEADVLLTEYREAVRSSLLSTARDCEGRTKWTFSGSLLFVVSVLTTVGYGVIAPVTTPGRIATMVYAVIGIPMTALCLASLGRSMANLFRVLYAKTFLRLC
ncbi:hypothetical protein BaRGS_00005040, partial [Batillaria attramentaria]